MFFSFFFFPVTPRLLFLSARPAPPPAPPDQLNPHPMLRVAASRATGALRPSSLRAAAGATSRSFSVEGKFGDKERAEEVRRERERERESVWGVCVWGVSGRGGRGKGGGGGA